MNKNKIIHLIKRFLFVLLSSAIMVFFSEKTFWYVQGYAIVELVLFYAVPVAVCLWVIDLYRVQRLSGIVLVGALFGFLVEGVLTPVIYEAGLMDPVMPAYFIGWHGLLSLVLGWYLIRKYLVSGHWKKLLLVSAAIGLFWGLWSLPYRLPESILEFQELVIAGENFLPGAWPVQDYLFFTVVFTGMLMAAHWLLGNGFWQSEFKLKPWEIALLLAAVIFLFVMQVFVIMPLATIKLLILITLVLVPLGINRHRRDEISLLSSLNGSLNFSQTLPLLAIPIFASLVYGLAALLPFPEELLKLIFNGFSGFQVFLGAGFFIWSWVNSLFSKM
ncbi:MAG: hypothetical protein ACC633_08055 [Anaerolineales bacterium]